MKIKLCENCVEIVEYDGSTTTDYSVKARLLALILKKLNYATIEDWTTTAVK